MYKAWCGLVMGLDPPCCLTHLPNPHSREQGRSDLCSASYYCWELGFGYAKLEGTFETQLPVPVAQKGSQEARYLGIWPWLLREGGPPQGATSFHRSLYLP